MVHSVAEKAASHPAREPQADGVPESLESASGATLKMGGAAGRRWFAILLGAWLVVNGIGLTIYHYRTQPVEAALSNEVDLGRFQYLPSREERPRLLKASFHLHVALAPSTQQASRERLAARKYRVQQDLEELLRRAHPGDFEDPRLRDLKRQLMEQINETLGMPALAEVIITELELVGNDGGPAETPRARDTQPGSSPPTSAATHH